MALGSGTAAAGQGDWEGAGQGLKGINVSRRKSYTLLHTNMSQGCGSFSSAPECQRVFPSYRLSVCLSSPVCSSFFRVSHAKGKLEPRRGAGQSKVREREKERKSVFLSWMSNGAKLALIFPSGDPPLHCYTCFLFWHRGGHAGTRVWRVRHPPPYSHLARPQGWSSSSRQKSIASHVVDHNFAKKRRERHTFLRKTPATDNSTTITTTYFRRRLIVMLRGMAVSRNGQLVSVVVAFINSDV